MHQVAALVEKVGATVGTLNLGADGVRQRQLGHLALYAAGGAPVAKGRAQPVHRRHRAASTAQGLHQGGKADGLAFSLAGKNQFAWIGIGWNELSEGSPPLRG